MATPFTLDGHQADVGASVGIALAPGRHRRVDELLGNADLALFAPRRRVAASYRFFEPEMEAAHARRGGSSSTTCGKRSSAASSSSTTSRSSTCRPAGRRLRGAAALAVTRRAGDLAGRVHPARRGDRADRADRRVGAAPSLPRGRALAASRVGSRSICRPCSSGDSTGPQIGRRARWPTSGLPAERAGDRDHRERSAAATATRRWPAAPSCASSACASRWTTSAPATRR